jgi:hypothetical protein
MLTLKRLLVLVGAWIVAVTGTHFALNLDWTSLLNERLPRDRRKFNVAFIPVT